MRLPINKNKDFNLPIKYCEGTFHRFLLPKTERKTLPAKKCFHSLRCSCRQEHETVLNLSINFKAARIEIGKKSVKMLDLNWFSIDFFGIYRHFGSLKDDEKFKTWKPSPEIFWNSGTIKILPRNLPTGTDRDLRSLCSQNIYFLSIFDRNYNKDVMPLNKHTRQRKRQPISTAAS